MQDLIKCKIHWDDDTYYDCYLNESHIANFEAIPAVKEVIRID